MSKVSKKSSETEEDGQLPWNGGDLQQLIVFARDLWNQMQQSLSPRVKVLLLMMLIGYIYMLIKFARWGLKFINHSWVTQAFLKRLPLR